jgi:predicted AlkP superfamily pyrophosphatase or phosphodiesterase
MPFRSWLALLGLCVVSIESGRFSAADDRHVVVISVDGLPAFMHDDPKASMPNIRRLRQKGVIAKQGMTVSNPSVTWPNHTTLMTGVQPEKHGVLFNGRLVRNGQGLPVRVEPKATQAELVAVPMLFDVLESKGLSSSAINWPCTRGSESLDDNFPDVPESVAHSTPRLIDELKSQGVLDPDSFTQLSTPGRDEIWTLAACHVLRARKPRLLALHLLNVDGTHHTYGAQTSASYSAVALADAMVGRVIDAIRDAGLTDRTAVFIVSDHGFTRIPKTLKPNVALRQAGLLTVSNQQVDSARVHVIPEGGIAMLYLTVPETAENDRAAVLQLFAEREGYEAVLTPDRFAEFHLPLPGDHPGMADLILVAKDGYGFNGDAAGEDDVAESTGLGTHGFLSTLAKMNATFIAAGAGIRKDASLDLISNADVAPTAAHLLGVTLDHADGRVLKEILAD